MNNKIIKTLSNRLTIVFVMLFTLSSCSDVLNEKPRDFLTPDIAYSTENGALQGINAIYADVRKQFFSYSSFGVMSWATHGSDIGYMGENPGSSAYLNSYTFMTSTSRWVVDTWNAGFRIIGEANSLIEGVKKADSQNFDQGEAGKNLYIAEARFFRAWVYRYLVSTYGPIPLLTKPIKDARVSFDRTPVEDIYKQMAEDYKFAIQHLPRPGEEAAPGRLTQGPAWHYLGEVYLEMDKPKKAVKALSHVVDDYGYHLMTQRFGTQLGNDVFGDGDAYYDLFAHDNQNLSENKEAMWVIQVEPKTEGGGVLQTAYIYGPRYFDMGVTPDGYQFVLGTTVDGRYTGYSDTLSRGTANSRGTSLVYYGVWGNDKGDTRNAPYNLKRHIYCDNPASAYYGKAIDQFITDYGPGHPSMLDTTKIFYPIHTKFLDPLNYVTQPARAGGGQTFKDWYALRFATTLLLRAEAYVDIGKPELAAKDINKVRARAHAKPVSPADVDMDYVLDERVRELYGEEWRLVTLRRTGKLIERVRKYNDNPIHPGLDIQEFNLLWPIPQSEIDLNSSKNFKQNPGY